MLRPLSLALVLLLSLPAAVLWAAEGSISGTVRDADGQALENVRVTVQAVTGAEVKLSVETNAHGKYRIVLPYYSRAYHFSVEKDGYLPVTETVELAVARANEVFNERQDFTLQLLPEGFKSSAAVRDDSAALYEYHPANSRYNKASELLEDGRLATARDRFRDIVEAFPDYGRGFTGLAMAHLALKEYSEAAQAADSALAIYERDLRALQVRHQAHAALGRDEASESLDALLIVKPGPEYAPLVYNEGLRQLEAGHHDEAVRRFQQALQLEPRRADAERGLIDALYRQKEYAAAAEAAENFLEHQAPDLHVLQLRYEAYRALGEDKKARKAKRDLDEARDSKASSSDDLFEDYNPG